MSLIPQKFAMNFKRNNQTAAIFEIVSMSKNRHGRFTKN